MGSLIRLNRNRSNTTAQLPVATPQTNGAVASPGAAPQINRAGASPDAPSRTNGAVALPGTARNYRDGASRSHSTAAARNYEDESWKSLLVLVVVFTATAIAMSVSVVLAGSNSWAEAMPLIVFVVVFALTKILLANALFYVMIRSDAHSESVAAKREEHNKANGLVIRRPRLPPSFNRPKFAGARPRVAPAASKGAATGTGAAAGKGASASKVRLAILTRKPPNPPPPRTDH